MTIEEIANSKDTQTKALFALSAAELVLDHLKPEDVTYRLAHEAVALAWKWMYGEKVLGDDLAIYLEDPDYEKDLGIRESDCEHDQGMLSALVVITIAIGFIARFAYEFENNNKRPAAVWETTDAFFAEIMKFIVDVPGFESHALDQIRSQMNENRQKSANLSFHRFTQA
ncbi:Immunity protein Imm6 [Noviherbaspirillum humi]|uniref:Immunity protein Imm6 n=1 Tax=Noviherbaspirillum humi TaxID=1688639 RepID=A0A239GN46_9BURK|nr:Imm6 family immunity protein [Noviherbaspirillum humi]SNS70619.1 Immunity protein Imm6 [Noviherbaspirillum humi]